MAAPEDLRSILNQQASASGGLKIDVAAFTAIMRQEFPRASSGVVPARLQRLASDSPPIVENLLGAISNGTADFVPFLFQVMHFQDSLLSFLWHDRHG